MQGPDGNPPSPLHVQRMSDSVNTLTLTPEQQTFSFSASAAGYLIIAMPQFPGWNVELDGHAVPVKLFAATMPAIQVGPGRHTVSYIYAPTSVRNGAILSGIGLLATLVGLYVGFFWKPFGTTTRPWTVMGALTPLMGGVVAFTSLAISVVPLVLPSVLEFSMTLLNVCTPLSLGTKV